MNKKLICFLFIVFLKINKMETDDYDIIEKVDGSDLNKDCNPVIEKVDDLYSNLNKLKDAIKNVLNKKRKNTEMSNNNGETFTQAKKITQVKKEELKCLNEYTLSNMYSTFLVYLNNNKLLKDKENINISVNLKINEDASEVTIESKFESNK
jgi:hypothetical protein